MALRTGRVPVKVYDGTRETLRLLAVALNTTQAEIVGKAVDEFASRHAPQLKSMIGRTAAIRDTSFDGIAGLFTDVDADTCNFAFVEVEWAVGRDLLEYMVYERWWDNDDTKPHSRAWLDAGWRVKHVDMRYSRVSFERT